MLKQDRDNSKIEGPTRILVCEFSTLAYSLLNVGVSEEKLDWALNEAKEYWRRENRVGYGKKRNTKEDDGEESLESLLEELKDTLLDLKDSLENEDEEEEE